MASTTALLTGFSGILANSKMLDVIGNNIANVNTEGFKSNRLTFAPTFSRTLGIGTAPTAQSGGSNPSQIGLGVSVAGTQRNMNNGSISVTGVNTDLAIEGEGMFIVSQGADTFYTRAGSFQLNAQNELVTTSGARVQGFGVDSQFNVQTGTLQDMTIPVGNLTIAEATRNVSFSGNLNAAGDVGTTGSIITFDPMMALGTAVPPPANPPFVDSTTRLVDLDDGSGNPMFTNGDSVLLSGAEKNGARLPDATLAIDNTTTIADYMAFLEESLGIDTSVPGEPGGVTIDNTTGVITIEGNMGEANDLTVESSSLSTVDSGGTTLGQPFTTTKSGESAGESVRTSFLVYDSLGTPLQVDLTLVLESKDSTGTTWRYYAESADNVGGDIRVGTGTMSFGTDGQVSSLPDIPISLDRSNTGAATPLAMTLSFDANGNSVTAFSDTGTNLAAVFQDGSPIGTLVDYSIAESGVVVGAFSNGLIRDLGQIALATFSNPEGLVDKGNNLFATGPNSGSPVVATPLSFGAGRVISSALELSNVDLSAQFINLILASTGYSASTRIITTANDLMQQLLLLGR